MAMGDGFLRKKKRDDTDSWGGYSDYQEESTDHSMWTAKIKEKILKKLGLC